jgi:hypothetical protein
MKSFLDSDEAILARYGPFNVPQIHLDSGTLIEYKT